MKQFTAILCFALMALASGKPNYNYQPPAPQLQQFRPNVALTNGRQQATGNAGIYSSVQAPPLPQFNSVQNYGTQSSSNVQQNLAQPQQQTFSTAPQLTQTVGVQQQKTSAVQQQGQQQQYVQQQQPIVQQSYTQQQQQPIVQQIALPQPQPQLALQNQQQYNTQQVVTQPQQVVTQQTFTQPQQTFTQQTVTQPQQTIITKDIFIHSAPEETEEVLVGKQLDGNVPIRKNYRIVFIKAPSQNIKLTSAALRQVQAANEEKTVIYVLSKKPDVNEIQQQISLSQQAESKVHKPEVYFIKYKTTEEAQRAQQEIQAQYDALGGSTHVTDEGIAPVGHISGGQLNLGTGFPIQTNTQYNAQQAVQQNGGRVQQVGQVQQQQQQQQSQSFVQQSYSSGGSTSSSNVVPAPSNKYLPVKALK